LDARYGAIQLPGDRQDPDIAAGSQAVLQLFNLARSQGVNRVVQSDNQLVSGQYSLKSDAEAASDVRDGLAAGNAAAKLLANQMVMARYINQIPLKQQLGMTVRRLLGGTIGRAIITVQNIRTNRLAGTAIVLGTAAAITGLAVGLTYLAQGVAAGNQDAKIALRVLVLSVQTIFAIVDPVLTITMPITTHVVHKNPNPSAGIMINFYLYLFSKENLRSTTN
jgi:hypothetical protein